jgi:hypothetical protein
MLFTLYLPFILFLVGLVGLVGKENRNIESKSENIITKFIDG